MRIESVQVGRPVRVGDMRTGFGKRAVAGKVHVGRTNLDGDAQADRRYHGGPDMAVLAYAADHYASWRAELCWPELPPGGFGENLSVSGTNEDLVCVGDVWRVGTALLEVASPRNPCVKISAFWRRPDLLDRVRRTGRIGWYLRVLEEGEVAAGMDVALVARPHPAWSVARAQDVMTRRREDPEAARDLAGIAALSERWKARLRGEPARL